MAAEEQTEGVSPLHERSDRLNPHANAGPSESSFVLPPGVSDWLNARFASCTGELSAGIVSTAGRWILRVEIGASSSSIEWGGRGEQGTRDGFLALRRWARERSLGFREEPNRGGELRAVFYLQRS